MSNLGQRQAAGLMSGVSVAVGLASSSAAAKGNTFSMLQQHIDDLTREKFELMRGLQEQQKLAAGLSDENLTITESFNRQVLFLTSVHLQLVKGHLALSRLQILNPP